MAVKRYNIKKSDPKVGTTLSGYVRDKNRTLTGSGYRWYKVNATPGERAVALDKQIRVKDRNGETLFVINPNGTLKTIIPASAKKDNTSSNSGKKISVKTGNSEEGNKSKSYTASGDKSKSNTSSTSGNKSRSNVNNNNSNSNKPKVTVASYGDFGGVEKGWRDTGQFNELIPKLSGAQLMWLDSKGISTENASSLQQGINNYFASIGSNKRISVDGSWGSQSLNALDEMFRDNSNEILNITQVLPLVVVESDLPPTRREGLEAGDVVSPVPQPQLITLESTIVNPEQLYTNYNTLPHYNKRQTRLLLRSMGINPYSLSGRQRKMIRGDLNTFGYIDPYEYLLYRNGGSLNRIPFYLEGTPKGGIVIEPDNTRVETIPNEGEYVTEKVPFGLQDFVPILGTYREAQRLDQGDPNASKIRFGISLAGDLLGAGMIGSVAKAASKYNKVSKALKAKEFFRPTDVGTQWIKVGTKKVPINAGRFGTIGTRSEPAVYVKNIPEVDYTPVVMAPLVLTMRVPAEAPFFNYKTINNK